MERAGAHSIPALLWTAAERDPDGVWLRTDDGTATFAAAAGQVAQLAQRLHDLGVRHGDLVLVTTRTTPAYLLVLARPCLPRRGHGPHRPGRYGG